MIISKLKDIKNEGVYVCFIQGNRQVSNKNVKSKTTSIKEYGILVPLMYVKGTKAVEDGCSLMTSKGDAITSEEADKYIVIVDGQHRYTAAIENGVSDEEIYLFESYAKASTKELLATNLSVKLDIASKKALALSSLYSIFTVSPFISLLNFFEVNLCLSQHKIRLIVLIGNPLKDKEFANCKSSSSGLAKVAPAI